MWNGVKWACERLAAEGDRYTIPADNRERHHFDVRCGSCGVTQLLGGTEDDFLTVRPCVNCGTRVGIISDAINV